MEYVLGNFQQAKWRKWLPKHVGQLSLGCVYAVEYSKDFLKIGATKNPWNRFSCLEREKNYSDGYKIQRFMLSNPFVGYKAFESEIHKALGKVRKDHTELFEIEFMFAVELIKKLADENDFIYHEFENGINNTTPYDVATIRSFLERNRNVQR